MHRKKEHCSWGWANPVFVEAACALALFYWTALYLKIFHRTLIQWLEIGNPNPSFKFGNGKSWKSTERTVAFQGGLNMAEELRRRGGVWFGRKVSLPIHGRISSAFLSTLCFPPTSNQIENWNRRFALPHTLMGFNFIWASTDLVEFSSEQTQPTINSCTCYVIKCGMIVKKKYMLGINSHGHFYLSWFKSWKLLFLRFKSQNIKRVPKLLVGMRNLTPINASTTFHSHLLHSYYTLTKKTLILYLDPVRFIKVLFSRFHIF